MSNNFNGTMNRPQSGTGGGGYRPPTGGVPGTSQRMTSYGQQAGQGQSLATQVEVSARPAALREGMRGQTRGGVGTSHGPQRQVIDRSYVIGLLRPKVTELMTEIERLKGQEDQIVRNSSTVTQMHQKQKALTEEIGKLKTQMSDVNFTLEQANTADVDQLKAQAHKLKEDNAELRRAVDKAFLGVKEQDGQVNSHKKQLEEEMKRLDERLQSSADQQVYQNYKATREEMYKMSDRVLEMQRDIRNLDSQQEQLKSSLGTDPDKKKAASLVLEILKKRQSRDEMREQCKITVEEERDKLIAQAKSTSHEIDVLNRKVVEGRDAISESRSRLQMLDEEMGEYSNDNMRKFQELQDQDREMREFMESFHQKEREELEQVKSVETLIQALLEHISQQEALKAAMPKDNAAVQIDAMGAEVDEKQKQLEAAQVTHKRLIGQLEEKKEELDKVHNLDAKIITELEQTATKMQDQQQEMVKFSDLDALRREIDQRKSELVAQRQMLLKQRDASKQQMHILSSQLETDKDRLNENDIHKTLSNLENKLRMVYQGAFALEEFVRFKEKEANYKGMKAECIRMVDEVNTMLREQKHTVAFK